MKIFNLPKMAIFLIRNKFFNLMWFAILSISLLIVVGCNEPTKDDDNSNVDSTTTTVTTTTTTIMGKIIAIKDFESTNLSNKRDLRVYLPQGYDPSDDNTRYKVVYMHDGQNIFKPGGPYGCWYVETAYEYLLKRELVEKVIIVGINNNNDRIPEYTPTVDAEYGGGNGEKYSKFVIEEVVPYIDANYKTKTGAENRVIMGSSLGGLISMYIAWNHPDVFGMAGCVSSSFWWDNRNLLKSIESYSGTKKNIKFWIDSGTSEGDDKEIDGLGIANDGRKYMVEDARRMANKLLELGWAEGTDLVYREGDKHTHSESAWSKRIYDILYYFLKTKEPTLMSIKCRPFLGEIGLAGTYTKTYVSVDLSYDAFLTTLLTYDSSTFTLDSDTYIDIDFANDGKVTPKAIGETLITAKYGTFSSPSTIKVLSSK